MVKRFVPACEKIIKKQTNDTTTKSKREYEASEETTRNCRECQVLKSPIANGVEQAHDDHKPSAVCSILGGYCLTESVNYQSQLARPGHESSLKSRDFLSDNSHTQLQRTHVCIHCLCRFWFLSQAFTNVQLSVCIHCLCRFWFLSQAFTNVQLSVCIHCLCRFWFLSQAFTNVQLSVCIRCLCRFWFLSQAFTNVQLSVCIRCLCRFWFLSQAFTNVQLTSS
ncbi:hypothetical protein RRG08_002717 [Elysia crispata]|uniref:Uncharacterized protein n=1 Tax=Elysia crispata TaxID=231223 RepID=A0AAE0XV75_9GAST|nr:hypothetical protein RRG08_002717 [Elysia crispata]